MDRRLRWWWLRWRMRHLVLMARWHVYQDPTDRNWDAYDRATDLLERIEAVRP